MDCLLYKMNPHEKRISLGPLSIWVGGTGFRLLGNRSSSPGTTSSQVSAFASAMVVTMNLLLSFVFMFVVFTSSIAMADDQPFPRRLTLAQALSMLDEKHPRLRTSGLEIKKAEMERLSLKAEMGTEVDMRLEWRQVDRLMDPGHDFVDDSRISIFIHKPISRFGRDSASNQIIDTRMSALAEHQRRSHLQMRVDIIRAFFDVIIADYGYAAIDEEMTLSYLAFDRARDSMDIYEETSEIEVRRLESRYQSFLVSRLEAANVQRMSRLRLALVLNRPNAFPSQVVEPLLSNYERELPDYDELFARVLSESPAIARGRLNLEEAEQRLLLVSRKWDPTLGLQVQGTEYAEHFSGSRDQYRAVVYLDIPIGQRLRKKADIEQQQIQVEKARAELDSLEYRLREKVLELVHKLGVLNSEVGAAKAELLYRELELDKVRLQYEMEVRARIGSANAEVAKALYRQKKAEYERAFVWEEIGALLGGVSFAEGDLN